MNRPPRRSRRRRGWRTVLLVLLFAAVFVVGVGVGEALHDRPDLGGTQTIVRTLNPVSVAPVPAETVTVTVSNP